MIEVTANGLREGIIALLSERFPDTGIYGEGGESSEPGTQAEAEAEAGGEAPYFIVKLQNMAQEQELGRRYRRTLSFLVKYVPAAGQAEASLHETAELLFALFREAEIGGANYSGRKMKYEIAENTLHFFFEFHFLVWLPAPDEPKMQSLKEEGHTKNGG
ncbi:hypothetical protein V3851_03765 [Paenibacillus sp. M1]|uniref:Uncharacterized protein n=1 Tax=Paenibacillus haidiansis TaxID=1574488 RepID=A0ABU7VPU4_9BACL